MEENERMAKHINDMILREVSYFNGWSVSEEQMNKDCMRAASNVVKYVERRNKRKNRKTDFGRIK